MVDNLEIAKILLDNKERVLFYMDELEAKYGYNSKDKRLPWEEELLSLYSQQQRDKNFNGRVLRSLELPSGNGIGLVRSMAKLYSVFATGGKELGIRQETLNELEKPATPPFRKLF